MQLYGGGVRLPECLRLRVKDLNFDRLQVMVRDAKGQKDRVTLLPEAVVQPLKRHLQRVRELHERAIRDGYGGVELPYALARKYPRAGRQWAWQYVYPCAKPSIDPRSGARRRHHYSPSFMQIDKGGLGSADDVAVHSYNVRRDQRVLLPVSVYVAGSHGIAFSKKGGNRQPLMTPIGRSRATFRASPAWCTTSTTKSTSL